MRLAKAKAFTLIELMVALLISGILASLIYASLFLIYGKYAEFSGRSEELLLVSGLRRALAHDFKASGLILARGQSIDCLTDSSQAQYLFEQGYVLRAYRDMEVSSVDTFFLECTQPRFFYGGQEAVEDGGVVEALTFQANTKGGVFQFSIQRDYTTAERMKFEDMTGGKYGRAETR